MVTDVLSTYGWIEGLNNKKLKLLVKHLVTY